MPAGILESLALIPVFLIGVYSAHSAAAGDLPDNHRLLGRGVDAPREPTSRMERGEVRLSYCSLGLERFYRNTGRAKP
jgi:hypothetical protein